MGHQGYPRTTILTGIPDLRLVALSVDDACAYYDLADRIRDHLTEHGDYEDLGAARPESTRVSLDNPNRRNAQFGIWLGERLIGRADLGPRTQGHFVLGYWLGGQYTGKAYATVACAAHIEYGKATLDATDVFAGVTKGNAKSEALLGRLGFRALEDRGTYTLFALRLT